MALENRLGEIVKLYEQARITSLAEHEAAKKRAAPYDKIVGGVTGDASPKRGVGQAGREPKASGLCAAEQPDGRQCPIDDSGTGRRLTT